MVRLCAGRRPAQLGLVDAAKLADHKWFYYPGLGQRWASNGFQRKALPERGKADRTGIAASADAARLAEDDGIVKMSTDVNRSLRIRSFEMGR